MVFMKMVNEGQEMLGREACDALAFFIPYMHFATDSERDSEATLST